MSRKLIAILALIISMSGFFLAQEIIESTSKSAKVESVTVEELDDLLALCDSLYELDDYDGIILESEKAEELIFANKHDSFYLSAFRQNRGNALYSLREFGESIEMFNEAIAATKNDEEGLGQRATQLFDRANAEYQLELLSDSYQSNLACEAILSKLENPDYDYLIAVYNDLSYMCRELGFYSDARKFLNKARATYEENKELVDSYNLRVRKPVSLAYSELLINAEALDEEKMLISLKLLEQLVEKDTDRKSELVRLSSAYNAVADYYINDLVEFSEVKLKKARYYLRLTKETMNVKEFSAALDQTRFNEAKLAYNIGEYEDARIRFEELVKNLSTDDYRRPFFEIMTGLVYMKLEQKDMAEFYLRTTIETTHTGKSKLLEDCSNYEPSTSIVHATLFAEVADTLRNFDPELYEKIGHQLQVAGMREFESNYQGTTFNKRLKYTYESLFQGMLEPILENPDPLAQTRMYATLLNQSETIENRLLWSKFMLNRRMGQLKVPDSVRREEQILRLSIAVARSEGDAQTCFELEKELEKMERSILQKYPEYGKFSQSHFDLAKMQKDLAKNTLVVKFVQINDQYYRFDIDRSKIECTQLKSSKLLEQEISEYLNVIQERREDRKLASKLAEKLLPRNYTNYTKITIINNLILGGLPFEALCNKRQEYLVTTSMITYAPHLIFINGEEVVKQGNGEVLVFYPSYSEEQTNLLGAQEESQLISNQFNSSYFGRKKATRKAFLDASSDASVLHLSMHAEINEEIGEQSCFLFNDDRLYLDELYGLNLSGQMAVLSACNTGKSFKDVRDGNASLQRAFMYAGITSTLSSLWEIPDQATQEIMIVFYEGLEKGMTNGEAIQAAKREFLNDLDDPHLQAPYFWAGFVLSGKDQSIELNAISNKSSFWMWGIISTSLLVVCSLFWWRSKRKNQERNFA